VKMFSSVARRGGAALGRRGVEFRGLTARTRLASTLVLADHADNALGVQTLSVVACAKAIGGDVALLVTGSDCDKVVEEASKVDGVTKVLKASDGSLDHFVAENVTALMEDLQKKNSYSHILFVSNTIGKAISPRLAAKLDVACMSDLIEVVSEDTFKRPMYAGNAIATVKSNDSVKVATVRGTAFDKVAAEGGSATVEDVTGPGDVGKAKWLADEIAKSDRAELTAAERVIAGGRALKSGENFKILYDLADKLDSSKTAVGASRAAVDAGYVPNDMQIGQTGKIVAPNLYIAVGISGAIQHLAGMKDAKNIVCINKDPEAPIFQVSDIGLEADLFKAVPEMIEKL